MGATPLDYCREIEAYLCRKNDGHLIRVVGPSFDLVSGWAAEGIPLNIAFAGIDRTFERYYRDRTRRRRPVKIDFCEHDVLDVFEEWRRAVGLPAGQPGGEGPDAQEDADRKKGPSLPAHLERVVTRLSEARASGALDEACDDLIDRVSRELDAARAGRAGVRGEARQALVARLRAFDAELAAHARRVIASEELVATERAAVAELAGFRDRMAPEAYERARAAAEDRLLRERLRLPTIAY